jgi:hypothetical protein
MGVTPQRIQQRRTKGWRMPENAVSVARPSRWGNWWVIKTAREYRPNPRYELVWPEALLVVHVDKHGHPTGVRFAAGETMADARRLAVDLYRRSLEATYLDIDGPLNRGWYLGELRGKNLACWCPLDQPCHADVLLELANGDR